MSILRTFWSFTYEIAINDFIVLNRLNDISLDNWYVTMIILGKGQNMLQERNKQTNILLLGLIEHI